MKKLTLGIAAVGLAASLGAYAALPTGAAPFQINIPNLKSGFMFNLTGMYARATNSDLDYAVVADSTITNVVNANVYSVKPKYGFGFKIGVGYVFPNSGNDLQLAYTHFNKSDSNSASAAAGQFLGPIDFPFLFGPIAADESASANGSADFKYNAFDIDVGQYVNVGTRLQMRFFGGFRYASIDDNFNSVYTFAEPANPGNNASLGVNFSSDMVGFGPRFGVDSTYHIGNCFGVVVNISSALLVSRIKTGTQAVVNGALSPQVLNTPFTVNLRGDDVNRIVPNLEGKLGLDYSFPFNSSVFSVEAGYQVSHYFNAIDRVSAGSGLHVYRKTTGFGIDGPYLSLNLKVS